MKVLRLNEASNTEIQDAKETFNAAQSDDERMKILHDFLKNKCGLEDHAWSDLERLGSSLLADWIKSFKWEEAGRPGNDFIAAMNSKLSSQWMQAADDRFVKAYNAYASGYIDKNKLEDSPLYNPSLYKNDEKDVKQILSYWDQLYDRLDDDTLHNTFYESNDNSELRTLADIQSRINDLRNGSRLDRDVDSINDRDRETLKSLIDKSDDLKNYARELLANEDNIVR